MCNNQFYEHAAQEIMKVLDGKGLRPQTVDQLEKALEGDPHLVFLDSGFPEQRAAVLAILGNLLDLRPASEVKG